MNIISVFCFFGSLGFVATLAIHTHTQTHRINIRTQHRMRPILVSKVCLLFCMMRNQKVPKKRLSCGIMLSLLRFLYSPLSLLSRFVTFSRQIAHITGTTLTVFLLTCFLSARCFRMKLRVTPHLVDF